MAALVSLEEEAVSAVSLLAALLDRAKNVNSAQLVDELADSVIRATAGNATDATRPISLLATLYNMRSNPSEKLGLLTKMIRLAASRQPSLLESHASVLGKWMDTSRLPQMLDEWNVEPKARRDLYRAAAEGATSTLAKQRFTLLVLETYKNAVRMMDDEWFLQPWLRDEIDFSSTLFVFRLLFIIHRTWTQKDSNPRNKQRLGRS
jgi:hypothetical protein